MKKYIDKATVVKEIEKRMTEWLYGSSIEAKYKKEECDDILSFLNTLEVKDMSIPALDNGNMPIERWKEACEAASCQANYRKSKGLTETCDDYFMDGVQWADEHPIKVKKMDYRPMDKDFERDAVSFCIDNGLNTTPYIAKTIAKHFFELGLKSQKGDKL